VVYVENGILLTDKQINGIQNLVARAVEGMDVENVVIVDAMGKQLSRSIQDTMVISAAGIGATSTALAALTFTERY
jgi:flagellar biosynthesis/type III secretory pathway M-ring protein FliF/YscJ